MAEPTSHKSYCYFDGRCPAECDCWCHNRPALAPQMPGEPSIELLEPTVQVNEMDGDELKGEYQRLRSEVGEAVDRLFRVVQAQAELTAVEEAKSIPSMIPVGWVLVTQAYGTRDGEEFDDMTIEHSRGMSMFTAVGLMRASTKSYEEELAFGGEDDGDD